MAAHWRDGNRWLWPSGFGPVAPSLVVVLMPQDGKDTHTLCSLRSGAPILSPSVPRGVGKSFKCGESLPPELVTKHIGKVWKGSFAANKRACLRLFPDRPASHGRPASRDDMSINIGNSCSRIFPEQINSAQEDSGARQWWTQFGVNGCL